MWMFDLLVSYFDASEPFGSPVVADVRRSNDAFIVFLVSLHAQTKFYGCVILPKVINSEIEKHGE